MAEQLQQEQTPIERSGRLALYTGVVLTLLGFLSIYLGYDGAATNPLPEAQLPYLISGGIFGLALVSLGGISIALSVALKLLNREPSAQATLVVAPTEVQAPTPAAGNGKAKSVPSAEQVFVAGGGNSFHAADCRLVERASSVATLVQTQAKEQGYVPCRICRP